MNAAEEIARQLRLRDMGGIIEIDFIDMDEAENRQKLYDRMRELMANDRARHNIFAVEEIRIDDYLPAGGGRHSILLPVKIARLVMVKVLFLLPYFLPICWSRRFIIWCIS